MTTQDPAGLLREAIPTTSPDLFHGHHPMCGWTIEADPKACNCVVALAATGDSGGLGLDVERLAEALAVSGRSLPSWDDVGIPHDYWTWREVAEGAVAEYARLSSKGEETGL